MDPLGAFARVLGSAVLAALLLFVVDLQGVWNVGCDDTGGRSAGSHCSREHPIGFVLAPIAVAVVVLAFIVVAEYWLLRRRRWR